MIHQGDVFERFIVEPFSGGSVEFGNIHLGICILYTYLKCNVEYRDRYIGIQTKYFLLNKLLYNDDLLSSYMKTFITNILLSHFMMFTMTSLRVN